MTALSDLVAPWLGAAPVPVLAAGSFGQGTVPVPAKPGDLTPVPLTVSDPRLELHAVPGLSQTAPADMAHGAEARIAGLLTRQPGFDGVVCLPGAQSMWAQVSAEEVVSFRTFLTGEMGDLLAQGPSLGPPDTGIWDDAAFSDAVADAMSRPEALAARLSGLRAELHLGTLERNGIAARLKGLLIGAELAASRPYWLGQDVLLLGSPEDTGPYHTALTALGLSPRSVDGRAALLTGLARFHARIGG